MSNALLIEGFDPKSLISSNQRLHHMARSKLTKHWRNLAHDHAAYLADHGVRFDRARIVFTIRFPTNHRRDVGNYYPTAKACLDGMVDAGLLPDDNDAHLIGPDLRRDPINGPHRIRIEIQELT